eukprot:3345750-Lingulodinium_polyedra.AAC.1
MPLISQPSRSNAYMSCQWLISASGVLRSSSTLRGSDSRVPKASAWRPRSVSRNLSMSPRPG